MNDKLSKKMIFRSFDENTFKEKNAIAEYEVMLNPASFSRTLATKKDDSPKRGGVASDGKWVGLESESFKFDLIFDGTGIVDPQRKNVEEEIEKFLEVVYIPKSKGDQTIKQAFVEISYGSLVINCKMSSISVDYQLFDRSGAPLRAKVTCSFTTVLYPKKKKEKPKQEPVSNSCCCPPPQCCSDVLQQTMSSNSDSLYDQIQK